MPILNHLVEIRVLDKAYRNERDACVKEKNIANNSKISSDKQQIESVARNSIDQELGPTNGTKDTKMKDIKGLRDRPRGGRHLLVASEIHDKIRQELVR